MGTTVGDAVEAARNRLRFLFKEQTNVLASDVAIDATSCTFIYDLVGVSNGSTIGLDMEDVVVVGTPTGKTANILRGRHGTTAIAHTAATSVVEIRPTQSRGVILLALLDEIRSWPPDLFLPKAMNLSTTSGMRGYDLGLVHQTDIIDILRIWDPTTDTSRLQARTVDHIYMPRSPAAIAASNAGVILGWTPSVTGTSLLVEYVAPFTLTNFLSTTELVGNGTNNVGLRASMFDVAWMGAARRRLTEAPRTDISTQPNPRNAQEVPAGLITAVHKSLEDDYLRRLSDERGKLMRDYGI